MTTFDFGIGPAKHDRYDLRWAWRCSFEEFGGDSLFIVNLLDIESDISHRNSLSKPLPQLAL